MKTLNELVGKSILNYQLEKRFTAKKNNDTETMAKADVMIGKVQHYLSNNLSFFLEETPAKLIPAYKSDWKQPDDMDAYERNTVITKRESVIKKILSEFMHQECRDSSYEFAQTLLNHPVMQKTQVVMDRHGKNCSVMIHHEFLHFDIPKELEKFQNDYQLLLDHINEQCETFFIGVKMKNNKSVF